MNCFNTSPAKYAVFLLAILVCVDYSESILLIEGFLYSQESLVID